MEYIEVCQIETPQLPIKCTEINKPAHAYCDNAAKWRNSCSSHYGRPIIVDWEPDTEKQRPLNKRFLNAFSLAE